jgi:hypothetical protein
MEQFPGNSKHPARSRDEPKRVERVVTSEVTRRKTPLGRRLSQSLIGGDAQSVWGYVFGEVLIPAARDMVADAVTGGVERMIFGDSSPGGRRGRSRYGSSSPGHTPYNRYSSTGRRDEPRREMSRRGRATHSFDEIIIPTRVEAEEVLDRLEDMIAKYDAVAVSDLYEMVGISGNFADEKWGWTDMRTASVTRARGGYLLNLPKPEPIT